MDEAELEFRVLGHPEIDRRPAPGGKLGVLLAALLLEAGTPVPADTLIEYLWPNPAASARATLHVYIGRLRQALGDDSGEPRLVRTHPNGYYLDIRPEQVDLHRFRELVRRAGLTGSLAEEAELLRAALALWRGPAFAGVASELLHREITPGLGEERLRVLERRIQLDLDLGRHAELVAELSELTARRPLHGAFQRQRMLALHRCGRSAEALRVYQEVYRRHVEELGIEPGRELTSLQEAILRVDPALDLPSSRPVPGQLPPDLSTFCGRDTELAELDRWLAPEAPPLVLTGAPGVGKTALAVHWARRVRGRFPDGQLHADLHGFASRKPARPATVLARFLRALGAPAHLLPTDTAELAAAFRSAVHGRRLLILLDNADSAEQIRPLLPGAPGCLVLITSRQSLYGLMATDDARHQVLPPLTAPAATELLSRIIGRSRVRAEPLAARELAELCGRLPLALRIAAVDLTGQPGIRLTDQVHALRTGLLDRLTVREEADLTVRGAFALSYDRLDPLARKLFRALGTLPAGEFDAPAAAGAVDLPLAETQRLLRGLTTAHLLTQPAPDRFRLPDLLREYARERGRCHLTP